MPSSWLPISKQYDEGYNQAPDTKFSIKAELYTPSLLGYVSNSFSSTIYFF